METTKKIIIIVKKARKRISGIKYRAKNKELLKQKKAVYYQNNKEMLCEKSRKYEKDNEKKVKARKKEYRGNNKEYISEWKKNHYENNKETIAKRNEEWKQKNIQKVKAYKKEWANTEKGREGKRVDRARRRALKVSTEDGTINKESLQKLREYQNNKCYHCNKDLDFKGKNKVHLDHYFPLSKGGTHSINNVVWSCSLCNLKKSNAIPSTLLI